MTTSLKPIPPETALSDAASTDPAFVVPVSVLPNEARDDDADESTRLVEARLSRILQGRDFPALSQQIIETISALNDDASSLQRLTNVVLREYSLTLSVVRTANSVHYRRQGRQIQSATRAMLLLGARTVRQLASSLLLFENYSKRSSGLKELMLMSLITANHAREVATKVGGADPEEAHLCGMFRNLGEVLIACHFPEDYARIHTLMRHRQLHAASAAHEVLGFWYEDLGAAMCRHWGMPDSVTQGIRSGGDAFVSIGTAITAFSHDLTDVIYRRDEEHGDPRRDLNALVERYASRLKLSREQVKDIVESALEETRELFTNANVRVGALRMRELSDAACSALGLVELGDGEWDAAHADEVRHRLELRAQLRQELESKVDATAEYDVGQVLMLAVESALRGAPFDRVVACVLTPDRARLKARSGLGNGVESLLAQFDFPMTPQGSPLTAALLQRKPIYVPTDRAMTVSELHFVAKHGVGQFGVFPVVISGQLIGCLYVDRVAREPLPDRATYQYLVSLAELVVKAIEVRRGVNAGARRDTPGTAAALTPPVPILSETAIARMPVETKGELVLRLLQGVPADVVASNSGVPGSVLEEWRAHFLAGAMARLGTHDLTG